MPSAVCQKELLHWQTLRKSIQEVARANLAAPLDCPFCTPGLSTSVNAFLLIDLFRPRFIFVFHWFYIYCHCDCTDAGQCLSWAKMLKYLQKQEWWMSMQSKHTWEIWEGSFPPCPCSVTSRWYSQIFNHSDRAFSGGHFEVCIGCTWQGPYDGRPSYRVREDYSHAVTRAFVACRYKLHDMPKFYLFLPGSITIVVTPTTTM